MSAYLDQSEFRETLRKIIAGSTRELPVVLNSRLLAIAKTAKELTPEASRPAITSYLGATLTRERVNKKGKTVRRYSYSPQPVVYAILNARRKKAGSGPIPRSEMAAAAKKFIQSKLRAVGSLKSGWTAAIGKLAAAVKGGIGDSGGPRVKMASQATPARDGWNPVASLEYLETIYRGGGREIDPRVVSALESAFAREQSEMEAHLENRLREVAQKAGAL